MNRIYQGKVTNVQIQKLPSTEGPGVDAPPKAKSRQPEPDWPDLPDWEAALRNHHALFQDAVNYYLVCLLALAAKGNDVWAIREKLDAKDAAGGDDELMIWRPFTRRGAKRRGLRDSVAPDLCPGQPDATPEDCFAADDVWLHWSAELRFGQSIG